MGQYIVQAFIYIEADNYNSFSNAWNNNEFDNIEIVNITEPER
jgi:glucose-6-phosphate 1-dehydrogenase